MTYLLEKVLLAYNVETPRAQQIYSNMHGYATFE